MSDNSAHEGTKMQEYVKKVYFSRDSGKYYCNLYFEKGGKNEVKVSDDAKTLKRDSSVGAMTRKKQGITKILKLDQWQKQCRKSHLFVMRAASALGLG